jgi:hypothetical protein
MDAASERFTVDAPRVYLPHVLSMCEKFMKRFVLVFVLVPGGIWDAQQKSTLSNALPP